MITSENKAVSALLLVELFVIALISTAAHFDLTFGVIEGVLLVIFAEMVVVRELRGRKPAPAVITAERTRRSGRR